MAYKCRLQPFVNDYKRLQTVINILKRIGVGNGCNFVEIIRVCANKG
jgi:hypothetical protein